ncbi:MAG: signal peptidase II [Proteobacteria bacterium]|nr:signal peptidase II [Pseudomonadota bacterium]
MLLLIINNKKPFLSLIIILISVVVLDQGTKRLAQKKLLDKGFHEQTDNYPVCGDPKEDYRRDRFVSRHRQSVTVVDGFFDLRYVENCASAFGLMSRVPESFRFPFFLVVSIFAIAFIPYLYLKTPDDQQLMIYALPFVLGGALGNLIDRVVFRYVVDFIRWYITIGEKARDWPTFNVADAAIVVGIGLMVLQMLPMRRSNEAAKTAGSTLEE